MFGNKMFNSQITADVSVSMLIMTCGFKQDICFSRNLYYKTGPIQTH